MKRSNYLHDLFQRINKNRLNDLQKSFSWSTKCGHSIDVYWPIDIYIFIHWKMWPTDLFWIFPILFTRSNCPYVPMQCIYNIHIFNRSKPWKKFCLILCTIYIYHKLVNFYWNFIYGQILYILSTYNNIRKEMHLKSCTRLRERKTI